MAPSQTGSGAVGSAAPGPSAESAEDRRSATFAARVRSLVRAIEENDEAKVEEAILRLSRSRRVVRPARVGDRRVRDAVRGSAAAGLQLAADARADPSRDVDLAGDVRPQGPRPARQVLPRAARPGADPDRPADRGLTVASFFLNAVFAFTIAKPGPLEIRPGLRAGSRASGADRALGRGGRAAARVLDDGRHTLGPAVVHDLAGHHRRRDDGQLRRHALAADRREEATTVDARQTVDERGRPGL